MNGARIARRAGTVAALAALAVVLGAQGASAADGMAAGAHLGIGDSHGIDTDRFTISVNDGNRLNPGDTKYLIASEVMKWSWEGYKSAVLGAISILHWVMKMDWVAWLLTPLSEAGYVVDDIMDRIGIAPLMLTVLGFIVAFWWFRGRIAAGLGELLMGCTIAALAAVYLANPMTMIAGDTGLIIGSRDAGMDMATAMVTNGEQTVGTDPSGYLDGTTASLVDTMIRTPHQILNYGSIIDGTPCEAVYNEAVGTDDARKTIGACNEAYKLHTDHPDPGTAIPVVEALPTSLIFSLFVLGMVAIVVLSVISAGWAGIKILVSSPMSVVPGAPRAFLFKALGAAATSAFAIAGTFVFIVVWMRFMNVIYQGNSGLPWLLLNRIVWILLIGGPIVYFLFRRRIARAMARAAERLAKTGPRPSKSSPPVVMPKVQSAATNVAKHYINQKAMGRALGIGGPKTPTPEELEARRAREARKMEAARRHAEHVRLQEAKSLLLPAGAPGTPPQGPSGTPPKSGPSGTPPQGPTSPSGSPSPVAPAPATPSAGERTQDVPTPHSDGGERLKQRIKTAGTAAVHVAGLVSSGGTSAIAEGAAAAVKARQIARAGRAAAGLVASTRTSDNTALRRKLEVNRPSERTETSRPDTVREVKPRPVTETGPVRTRPEQPAAASAAALRATLTAAKSAPVARRMPNA